MGTTPCTTSTRRRAYRGRPRSWGRARHAGCLPPPARVSCSTRQPHSPSLRSSQLHWSELPAKFVSTLEEQGRQRALVFRGIGFFDIGVAVFTRRYRFLLDHLVRYNDYFAGLSDAQAVEMLRARLAPINVDIARACK